jgi:hypothetical protein
MCKLHFQVLECLLLQLAFINGIEVMSRFDREATALASHNENDSEIILCDLRRIKNFPYSSMPSKISPWIKPLNFIATDAHLSSGMQDTLIKTRNSMMLFET